MAAAAGAAGGCTAPQRAACERVFTRCQQAEVPMPDEHSGFARIYVALVNVEWDEEAAFAGLQEVDAHGMVNWGAVRHVAPRAVYPLGDPEAWVVNHRAASTLLFTVLNGLGFHRGNELTPSIMLACVGRPPPSARAPMSAGVGPLPRRPNFKRRRAAGAANGGGAAGGRFLETPAPSVHSGCPPIGVLNCLLPVYRALLAGARGGGFGLPPYLANRDAAQAAGLPPGTLYPTTNWGPEGEEAYSNAAMRYQAYFAVSQLFGFAARTPLGDFERVIKMRWPERTVEDYSGFEAGAAADGLFAADPDLGDEYDHQDDEEADGWGAQRAGDDFDDDDDDGQPREEEDDDEEDEEGEHGDPAAPAKPCQARDDNGVMQDREYCLFHIKQPFPCYMEDKAIFLAGCNRGGHRCKTCSHVFHATCAQRHYPGHEEPNFCSPEHMRP